MYKLLVVDDDYESRTTLCSCFPWDEVEFEIVAQFDNAKDAMEYTQNHTIHAILCDIKMPGMSGIDFARELYSQKVKTKIIFISGYRDFEYAQKALAYGVRYYIVKPARYQELVNVFRQLKQELDSEASIETGDSSNPSPVKPGVNIHEKLVKMIKLYIEENFKDVTLESVAKHVFMNPNYVSQFFKHKTGQNFSEYIIEIKMKKAAELLKDARLKTYEVSEMVGYTNAKNFTRSFKNYFNMSPREYRNSEGIES